MAFTGFGAKPVTGPSTPAQSGGFSGFGYKPTLEPITTPTPIPQVTPIETAVAQTYPVAKPEPQEPKSLFKRYGDWSAKTGRKLGLAGAAFLQGSIGEATKKDIPFAGAASEGIELYQIKQAKDKFLETGDGASRVLLEQYFQEQENLKKKRENIWYEIGEGVRSSATFGAELAIATAATVGSAGLGSASFAAPVGRKVAIKSAEKYLETLLADKVLLEALEKGMGKYAIKKVGQGLTIAGVTSGTHTPAGAIERMVGDPTFSEQGVLETVSKGQDLSEATINSLSQNVVEVASEFTGGIYKIMAKPLQSTLGKVAIIKAVQNKLKTNPSTAAKVIEKMGWNGVFGEAMEELHGKSINAVLAELGLGDQEWTPLTMREVARTLLTIGVMGTGVRLTQSAFDSIENKRRSENERKAKQEMVESGLEENIVNSLETNGEEETKSELVAQLGVNDTQAAKLISIATTPAIPTEEEAAQQAQKAYEEMQGEQKLASEGTEAIIPTAPLVIPQSPQTEVKGKVEKKATPETPKEIQEKITLANEQGRVTEEARKGIAFPNGSNPKITYVKGMRRAGLSPEQIASIMIEAENVSVERNKGREQGERAAGDNLLSEDVFDAITEHNLKIRENVEKQINKKESPEEMQGEQKLASEGTEAIIPKVNALIEKVSEYSGDIKDLEDELQQLKKMREELEKRTEPEAEVAKEAILLLPAPKAIELPNVPKDIESGDTVKIKTNITGIERNAEVVEVRDDSVVAIVKGDVHFPETPMVFPVEHFTAKPHVPKVTDVTYSEWKKREAEKRARHAKEQAEKLTALREKAKKAEKTPAISAVFTKEADKIEGKKPVKKEKKVFIDTTPDRIATIKEKPTEDIEGYRLEVRKTIKDLTEKGQAISIDLGKFAKKFNIPTDSPALIEILEEEKLSVKSIKNGSVRSLVEFLHKDSFGGSDKNYYALVKEAKKFGLEVEQGESEGARLSLSEAKRKEMSMMDAAVLFSSIINEKAKITGADYHMEPNADGTLTAYHGTSAKNAKSINENGFDTSAYLSPEKGKDAGGVGGAMEYGNDIFEVTFDPIYMEFNGLGEIKLNETDPIISFKQISWSDQSAQDVGNKLSEPSTMTPTQEPIVTSALKKKAQSEEKLKVMQDVQGRGIIYKKIGSDEVGDLYEPFMEHKFDSLDQADAYLEKLLQKDHIFDSGKNVLDKPSSLETPDNSIESLLKSHDATIENLRTGNITPKELQDAFGNMVARESDIMEWLNKMTIAELRKKFGGYPRRDDTKKDVVKSSYRNLLELYAPSDSITYHAFSESYSEAVARYVNSATEETIAEYAKRVAERRAEREAWMKDKMQAIKDPQTLDQFRTFIEANGADKMTDEQRIRYDNLVAEKIKADTEKKIQQKALVKGVDAGVGFEIHQTKHTKTGADLYVVTMGARVEKDVYSQLNATAKKLGGYYSSFRGAGAIPGFQFKTPEDAQSFMKAGQGETVDTTEKITDKKEAQKSKTTNKLALLAEQLEERATEKLNQDRKTNTAKRAREASYAEESARADIQMAQTMKNIAGAIASGRAKFLDGITAKAHIEEMESALRQAKWKQENLVESQYRLDHKDDKGLLYDPYEGNQKNFGTASLSFSAQQEIRKLKEEIQNGPVTDQTISALDDIFPTFIGGNLVTDILEPASKKKGYKLLANRYMKIIPKGDKRWTPTSFQQVNDLADMMKQVDATGMYAYPIERTQRLQRMGVTSTPQFRAMLREYVTFRGDAVEADKAKELERALVGSKVGFDFFPTPRAVADQMVQEAGITSGMKVLEPSAGNGNIAEAIRDAGATPEVIELSSQLREILEAKGFTVVGQDFLEHTEGGYDAIIQNPPFSNNADIAHVKHAYDLLAPGGKLVSIVGEGAFFRSGKTETEFRDWLDAHEATVEQLPAGTFEDKTLMATTGANGRIVVIEKPKVDFMVRDSLGRFATEDMASSVAQVVSGRYKTYFRIPQDRFEEMRNLVDTPETEIASQINAMSGAMYHLTAKSPAQMEAEGFEDGGWITPEILLRETVPDFRTVDTLTTKILESLGTRESVSKQFIIDATKQQGVSGPERGLILDILEGEGDKVNVQDFKNKVKTELLPLDPKTQETGGSPNDNRRQKFVGYAGTALGSGERGPVANYIERIYESPIKTSAGEVHFPGDTENYFAHSRIEDMADPSLLDEDGEPVDIEEMTPQQRKLVEKNGGVGTTRRVIEIQSDLFQKGRLDSELERRAMNGDGGRIGEITPKYSDRVATAQNELAPLQPYRNTWQERIIREEVAQAALDGKTKLQFPTGETAMKIEGLGVGNQWYVKVMNVEVILDESLLEIGGEIRKFGERGMWIITDVTGDGKFRAVPKKDYELFLKITSSKNYSIIETGGRFIVDSKNGVNQSFKTREEAEEFITQKTSLNPSNIATVESFDISGKVDTENPIYKFYEKEVAKYLRNKYGAKLVTDAQGVTWNEITITPDMKGPVLAFRSQDIEDRLEERLAGPLIDQNESMRILAWFTDRLGYDIPVQFFDKILTGEKVPALFSMSEKWQRAWGVTYKGVFGFEKLIPAHTIPHEIIHFTINNLDQMADDFGMTRMELLTAANEGKMPLSAKEEAEIGERIARRFERVWKQFEQGKAHTEKGIVGQFFDKLVDFIKRILQIKPSDIEILRNFYDKVLYMRRTGPVIRGARANLSRFEIAPGVVNFKEGEFKEKDEITMDMFDAMSEEEQREVIAMEAAEDIRGYGTLSPIEELAESLLNGSQKVSTRTDIKTDIRETLGNALYMRMFRKNAVQSWDELIDDLRRATGYASYTGNDLVEVVIARDKARKLAVQEHIEARKQARKARAQKIAEAKSEADKIKLIRDIEKDLTRMLLEKKANKKNLGQKIGMSRFQSRMKDRFPELDNKDIPYQKVTKAGEMAKSEAYYEADKQKTIQKFNADYTDDVTRTTLGLTIIQHAQSEGDSQTVADTFAKLTQHGTRSGQEISMFRDAFNDRNPMKYMGQLLSYRKLLIRQHWKPAFTLDTEENTFEKVVERRVEKARKKSPKKLVDVLEIKGAEIDAFLNSLAC